MTSPKLQKKQCKHKTSCKSKFLQIQYVSQYVSQYVGKSIQYVIQYVGSTRLQICKKTGILLYFCVQYIGGKGPYISQYVSQYVEI